MGGRTVDDLDEALGELRPRLGPPVAEPEPLEGGITNRNYRVKFRRHDCVLRLAGKETALLEINRAAEWMAGAVAAELGIAPRVLAQGEGWLVTEYLVAQPADRNAVRAAPQPIGEALRDFHDSGLELPSRFWVPDLLEAYAGVVHGRGGRLPEVYEAARETTRRIAAVLPLDHPVPCHNDLLPGNVLLAGPPDSVRFVDWEYAGMGHRLFDLGNLAANAEFGEVEEVRLLEAYLGRAPEPRELAGMRLMRLMSDAREAAWGIVQGVISEIDFDFEAYANVHFQRFLAAARDPRTKEWSLAAAA